MTRIASAAAILVLASGGMAQEPARDNPAPPPGIKNLGPALTPLQKELSGRAGTAVVRTEEAKKAKAEQDAAAQELARARSAYEAARKEPPPPNAAPEVVAARQARIADAQVEVRKREAEITQKTLSATQAEKERRTAVADLDEFRRANPDVKLPENNPLAPKMKALDLPDLSQNRAAQQARDSLADPDAVFDGRRPLPGGNPRPNRPNEPIPDPAVERERKAIDDEVKAITAESKRLEGWKADLERRRDDIESRVNRHNANPPDQTSESAVRIYNDEARRLRDEASGWEAEARRFEKERVEFLERCKRGQDRVEKFLKKK